MKKITRSCECYVDILHLSPTTTASATTLNTTSLEPSYSVEKVVENKGGGRDVFMQAKYTSRTTVQVSLIRFMFLYIM